MSEFEITPRGGVEEVGRSCFHLQIADRDYLVDCGLKQAEKTEFPTFRGISPREIDAVFITHAHIDHIGALPVAEQRNLLADDAPILMTRPTNAIASILLHDSLKIHKLETSERNEPQEFTADDVESILNRVQGVGYDRDSLLNVTYEFGDAAHLLGSAWLALEHRGRRVVFSGDLGGRSGHLGDIDSPPKADHLFLESTYGDTLTHRSFSDARTDLYNEIKTAHKQDVPVLIPTFGVGRAQEILQLIRERESDLAGAVDGTPTVVYDGLITDSLPVYEVFCQAEYMGESIVNYKMETGDAEPFTPDCATTPDSTADRESLLRGDDAPIIIAPSGMLTGGWSPYYLRDLSRHYDDARVIFTGYQAEGTPGRQLLEAPGDRAKLQVRALPAPEDYDAETEDFEFRTQKIAVPTDWIRNIRGMSGHAAGNTLLQFARDAAPTAISLVHGPPAAAAHLEDHLESNTDAESVEIASHRSEIQVGESGAVTSTVDELLERQNRLENELAALREDIQCLKEEREM